MILLYESIIYEIRDNNFINHFWRSLRQGLSGAKEGGCRCWSTLCHEGAAKGLHYTEKENDRAHEDREANPGGHPRQSLLNNSLLCVSN